MTTLSLPKAILFDLDGTLADTAPDLAAAIQALQEERNLPITPYEVLRPVVSAGGRGLIGAAFGLTPDDEEYAELIDGFIQNYGLKLAEKSHLFDGVQDLLSTLDDQGVLWGIVTNKHARFTDPLVPQIGLQHAGCIISGDTTAHPKPHPAPLIEAAKRLEVAPENCWYVGDDLRDIQAGKAAQMRTIAADWGYADNSVTPSWDADAICATPLALKELFLRIGDQN